MMRKRLLFLMILLMATLLPIAAVHAQEDMTTVDNSDFENPQRPPARFYHDQHNENAGIEECNECHHVYEDGVRVEDESSEDQLCSDCHMLKAEGRRPALMKAFHLRCKGCHIEQGAGPVTCGECHQK